LRLYDFDRSSGEFSNFKHIPFEEPEVVEFASCEWSPNSRFLYLASQDSLLQVDTWEENLNDGTRLIDIYNGIADPLSTQFFMSALGPDCRIYIRPGSSSYSFHVINKPDELGVACDFQQQAIKMPHLTSTGSFPNFPRFRVDEEEKCDPSILSAFGEDIYWRRDMLAYPNPASNYVNVDIPEQVLGDVYIINIEGVVVRQLENIIATTIELDVSDLSTGIYSVEFVPRDNRERVVYTVSVTKI